MALEKPSEIISDQEVTELHRGNFGSMTTREVIDEGVLKSAFGYASGSTALSILRVHKLVQKPHQGGYARLTEKGIRYLRAVYGNNFREIFLSMREEEKP